MPAELNPIHERTEQTICERPENYVATGVDCTGNPEEKVQKTLKNKRESSKKERKMAENGQKVLGNEGGKECFLFDKSLKYNSISPNEYATNKENIKDIITTAATRKEEKTAAADDDLSAVTLTERNRALSPGISSFIIPNATLQRLKCHTSVPQMPHFSTANATRRTCPGMALGTMKCGILFYQSRSLCSVRKSKNPLFLLLQEVKSLSTRS